ncbi:proB [Symbiodinium sp. CCMP2456]|nr:proB [Symbiodinium sp. CCMP2456]
MIDLARQQLAHDADPLVVKVGTRCLTLPDGTLDECQVESIAEQLVRIGAGTTRRVVLVSSGAVGAGIGLLKLPERPTDLPSLQAAAAVGQCHLMESYNRAFQEHGLLAAQVLLTADDINDRRRYLNFRNAIRALFEYGAIPIVNENDTVRTAELSRTGGMLSKLQAASIATHAGESVILANGRSPNILVDLMAGEPLGTLIPGQGGRLAERKRWIGSAAMPIGALTLDAGAVEAVAERGKSLLPIGIKAITGIFDKGDLVSLIDEAGVEIARGLTNYDSSDLGKIMGQPSEAIADILGRAPYSVAVHRNDLALVRDAEGS